MRKRKCTLCKGEIGFFRQFRYLICKSCEKELLTPYGDLSLLKKDRGKGRMKLQTFTVIIIMFQFAFVLIGVFLIVGALCAYISNMIDLFPCFILISCGMISLIVSYVVLPGALPGALEMRLGYYPKKTSDGYRD